MGWSRLENGELVEGVKRVVQERERKEVGTRWEER